MANGDFSLGPTIPAACTEVAGVAVADVGSRQHQLRLCWATVCQQRAPGERAGRALPVVNGAFTTLLISDQSTQTAELGTLLGLSSSGVLSVPLEGTLNLNGDVTLQVGNGGQAVVIAGAPTQRHHPSCNERATRESESVQS